MINSKIHLIESFQVPELKKRMRLSDLSFEYFRSINSRKAVKKAVKEGRIWFNGKCGYTADFINGGETIFVYQSLIQKQQPSIDLQIEVLFEDDYLAMVNKPPGMEVSGNKRWTLEHALPNNITISTQTDALRYPEAIHRLDYPTSGLLLIGKTQSMVIALNRLFEERKIQKVYHAICIGEINGHGFIELDIDDKQSKSEFKVLQSVESPRFGFLNLVKLIPHTGRRHQLRKHLSFISNPILGDLEYGKENFVLKGKGLYLHASSLEFVHPITAEIHRTKCDLPKKFSKIFPVI